MKLKEIWLMPGIEEGQMKRNKLGLLLFKKRNNKSKMALNFLANMMKRVGRSEKKYLSPWLKKQRKKKAI